MRQTIIALLFACGLTAQTKLPPSPADYGQWETLVESGGGGGRGGRGGGGSGGLSPDGKWLAYGINRTNGKNELRVVPVAGGEAKVTPFGTQATFSADSKWLAFSIGRAETDTPPTDAGAEQTRADQSGHRRSSNGGRSRIVRLQPSGHVAGDASVSAGASGCCGRHSSGPRRRWRRAGRTRGTWRRGWRG